jgi:ADP-ribose pyrophosphatase
VNAAPRYYRFDDQWSDIDAFKASFSLRQAEKTGSLSSVSHSVETVEILEKRPVFRGYFRVDFYRLRHIRFDGSWSEPMEREVFERGHAAALLPYDPIREQFVLCEQFRVGSLAAGMDPWQLEIVAGIIEESERPEEVALREVQEESGLVATELWPIQRYLVSPGGTSETVFLYLGKVSSENAGGIFGLASENENIRASVMPEAKLREFVDENRLTNAATIIAAQWFFLNRAKIREKWAAGA